MLQTVLCRLSSGITDQSVEFAQPKQPRTNCIESNCIEHIPIRNWCWSRKKNQKLLVKEIQYILSKILIFQQILAWEVWSIHKIKTEITFDKLRENKYWKWGQCERARSIFRMCPVSWGRFFDLSLELARSLAIGQRTAKLQAVTLYGWLCRMACDFVVLWPTKTYITSLERSKAPSSNDFCSREYFRNNFYSLKVTPFHTGC